MRTRRSRSKDPASATLSCSTREGRSSIIGLDLANESIKSVQSRQVQFSCIYRVAYDSRVRSNP
uniref:Predicted protein n=2 Tax=Hordeum vulgare subsp. vulgare TaxID=112509 RepID=F2EEB6_HORVV|nr:predicted protein [Hordeum vulgare subsp. vulgare]